ncbi:MAG: hypothetical protein OHK0019_22410 [Saprospiraceae bacterium]
MRLIYFFVPIILALSCQKHTRTTLIPAHSDAVARVEKDRVVLLKTDRELTQRVLTLAESVLVINRHEVAFSTESGHYYLRSVGYDVEKEQSLSLGFLLKEVGDGLLVFDPAYKDCFHFCVAVSPCFECDIIIYEPCQQASAQCSTAETGGHANVGVTFKNVPD